MQLAPSKASYAGSDSDYCFLKNCCCCFVLYFFDFLSRNSNHHHHHHLRCCPHQKIDPFPRLSGQLMPFDARVPGQSEEVCRAVYGANLDFDRLFLGRFVGALESLLSWLRKSSYGEDVSWIAAVSFEMVFDASLQEFSN